MKKTVITLLSTLFMLSGCQSEQQFDQQNTSITIEISIDMSKLRNKYQDQLRTIPNLITLHNNVTNKTYSVTSSCPVYQKKCTVSENVTFPSTYDIEVSSVEGYDELISWKVINHNGEEVIAAMAPNAAPYNGTFSL
jgi:uncharacterized lipoprotein NlpE involved in copper resistance